MRGHAPSELYSGQCIQYLEKLATQMNPEKRPGKNSMRLDSMMRRRTSRFGVEATLAPWLLFLAAALLISCDAPSHKAVRAVILISCDTLRADHLGFYGYPRNVSPNLDAFARRSVVFERAYATAPHTNPAFSSLLTSRMPREIGVAGGNRKLMPASVETLPEHLAEAGIESAAIVSNWALRPADAALGDVGIAQGFAHFDSEMQSENGLREGHFERLADATSDAAIRWLETRPTSGSPFFLWVHYQDPHGPYTPPERFAEQFDDLETLEPLPPLGTTTGGYGQIPAYQNLNDERRPQFYRNRYDAEIRFFDDEVGRLLEWLDTHGYFDDSLIVFTSDHGESLGEHGYWFSHEANLYDEAVRVPMVIHYPADMPLPVGDQLVGHLDFWPTVLSAFNLPETPSRGVSLVTAKLPKGRIMAHTLHDRGSPLEWSGITEDRYRLVLQRGRPELYDLHADPGELINLAEREPERIKSMLRRYFDFMKQLPDAEEVEGVDLPLDEESRRALEALGYLNPEQDES